MIDERDGAPVRLDPSKFVKKDQDLFGDGAAAAANNSASAIDNSTTGLVEDFNNIQLEDIDVNYKPKEFSLDPETIYDII